jgi:DNA-binding CsgD family transcriptional regulator
MPDLCCEQIRETLSTVTQELGWDDFLYIFSLERNWVDQRVHCVLEASPKARHAYSVFRRNKLSDTLLQFDTLRSDLPQLIELSKYNDIETDAELVQLLLDMNWEHGLYWPTYGHSGALGYLILYRQPGEISKDLLDRTRDCLAPHVVKFNAWSRELINESDNSVSLSPRETECILLVSKGKTSKEIARCLTLAERTVEFHIQNAMKKLGVSTRSQAVALFSLNHFPGMSTIKTLRESHGSRANVSSC